MTRPESAGGAAGSAGDATSPGAGETATVPSPNGGSSRMELRRRRRRRRRQIVAAVLAALVVLTLVVTWRLATDPAPPPAAPDELADRTQRTLLLQVQAPNGDAAAAALLAADAEDESAAAVLLPPQVLVPVPGSGSLTLARAVHTVPPENSRAAVADLLGVLVDEGWVLNSASLQALIDALGGIPVEVDRPVERGGQLILQPGRQRLTGIEALAFLTYRPRGEPEAAGLARLQAVLDGVLESLPESAEETAEVLGGLGERSVATLPPQELAQFLLELEAADDAGQLQYDTLPVVPIDTGAGAGTARLDAEPARAVVDRLLAESVPPGARAEGNRVLVLNGVGTPGLGEQVRAELVPEGFVFVGSRNAARFGYARTQVLVPEASAEALELGTRVAEALGLTSDAVRSTDQIGSVADVVVLIGRDFEP